MEFYAERFRALFRELGDNVTNLGSQVGDASQQLADWLRNRGGGGGWRLLGLGGRGGRARATASSRPSRAAAAVRLRGQRDGDRPIPRRVCRVTARGATVSAQAARPQRALSSVRSLPSDARPQPFPQPKPYNAEPAPPGPGSRRRRPLDRRHSTIYRYASSIQRRQSNEDFNKWRNHMSSAFAQDWPGRGAWAHEAPASPQSGASANHDTRETAKDGTRASAAAAAAARATSSPPRRGQLAVLPRRRGGGGRHGSADPEELEELIALRRMRGGPFGGPGALRPRDGRGRGRGRARRGDVRLALLRLLAEEPAQRLSADADDRGAQRRPLAPEPRLGLPHAGSARGRGPDPVGRGRRRRGASRSPTPAASTSRPGPTSPRPGSPTTRRARTP